MCCEKYLRICYFGQYSNQVLHSVRLQALFYFIYENYKTFDDKTALSKAKEWAEQAYRLYPEDMQINNTYAHILFELGFASEAIHHEEIALKKAQETKSSSAKRYEEALLRFKQTKG